MKKLISLLLIIVMALPAIGSLSLPVFATNNTAAGATAAATAAATPAEPEKNYYTDTYASKEDKLATMTLKLEKYGYQLYFDTYSGEFALVDTKSGQMLFSNPYDVGATTSSENIKNQLLSQLIIKYTDNDAEKYMYSFLEAAIREQIIFKNLKDGIRVEYTLGEEETRQLVPKMMEKSRFEELLLPYMEGDARAYKQMNSYYQLKDTSDPMLTDRMISELEGSFPITKKLAVYVFDQTAKPREILMIENYIKLYCPHYTYETLEEDHMITEYEDKAANPAKFKMSLEYYLDEEGLSVRLPANGIRFDESSYSLSYISILPYMGAGSQDKTGYTFIPDGSGTLIRFEDVAGSNYTLSGQLYGLDFAYHEIEGSNQQTMRLPVYGVVENYTSTSQVEEVYIDPEDGTESKITKTVKSNEDKGFFAIIEEGDALASICSEHGGGILHKYNSVYTTFSPRPKDSYNLRAAISVAANTAYTVVSERKYTGSYRIKVIMLTDNAIAAEKGITDYYEASYTGMAKAYRDYLIKKGELQALAATNEKIPLYIESFGVIETQETFLSIPVTAKTPLTTFEDLKTMYTELAAEGISNINYKLTGFANEGMFPTMPYYVDFEKKVGGNSGYNDFLKFAIEKGIGVFPEFEFSYLTRSKLNDGFSLKNDALKTIDDRYTQKRVYDATLQAFTETGYVGVSASVFDKFYTHFFEEISKLGYLGVSVASLGSDLNSDFDTDDPYNREDSKAFVEKVLGKMDNDIGNIMVEGGNAYTLKYADHILNVALDSSRYTSASEAIPFFGLVFHGYKNFAGTPTNMAGDIKYEMLKIIENGASPYFILLYQNTERLKESGYLSKYYSISYEIWKNDLVRDYNTLNDALASVQYSPISDHEFIEGYRVPTEAEIAAATEAAQKALDKKLADAEEAKKKAERDEARKKREAEEAGLTYTAPEAVPVEQPEMEDLSTLGTSVKYLINDGTIVKITYSNGTYFILNYNSFDVTVDGTTIGALGFVKVAG